VQRSTGFDELQIHMPRMPIKAGRITDMPLTDTSWRSSSWNMTTQCAAR
jgi:hypothetical protein